MQGRIGFCPLDPIYWTCRGGRTESTGNCPNEILAERPLSPKNGRSNDRINPIDKNGTSTSSHKYS